MTGSKLTLVIGNKNYSSWSLRAWLYMQASGLDFDEIRIPMFAGDWKERILSYSSAGRVPVLLHGDIKVWDSLAIMTHLLEHYPGSLGWPDDPAARGQARAITAEMHSGFIAIRDELPLNIRIQTRLDTSMLTDACQSQIQRLSAIWTDPRRRFATEGPFLYGQPGIADVMYAPVALRFHSYGIELEGVAQQYVQTILDWEPVQRWVTAAREETETLDFIDNLTAPTDTPLTPG